MSTVYINEVGASQLRDENEANPSAENGSWTSWDRNKEFILIVLVGFDIAGGCNKATGTNQIFPQYQKDGGSWVGVGTGLDIAPGYNTTLVDGAAATQRITTNTPAAYCSGGYEAGLEVEGKSPLLSGNIDIATKENWTELHFALNAENAAPGSTYAFRLYDDTNSQILAGTIQSQVTMDLEISIQEPVITVTDVETVEIPVTAVDINVFEPAITVTDVPTVSLPDALEISIAEPLITVTDVETVELPDPLEIDVFEAAIVVTGVVDDMLVYQENLEVSIAEPLITVTDVVTDIAQELVPSVFDEITVTDAVVDLALELVPSVFDGVTVDEDITVTLPDALVINTFEAAITVTDVVDDVVVQEPAAEDLEINVFDEATVTDVVDHIGISNRWWTTFSEYPLGAPSDWTEHWQTTQSDSEVVASTDKMSDKELLLDHLGGTRYTALSWDDIGSPRNVDLLILTRVSSNVGNRMAVRGGGSENTEDAYYIYPHCSISFFYMYRMVSGTGSMLDSNPHVFSEGSVYWFRLQAFGNTIRAKSWAWDAAEPGSWELSATDSNLADGWVGIFKYLGDCNALFFSVATYGEEPIKHPLISEFDTSTVTDVVEDIQVLEGELSIDVFDEVTVTDVIHCIDVEYHYWTDFSEYTTDQQPSDWTIDVGGAAIVRDGVKTLGGKYFEITAGLTPGVVYPDDGPLTVDVDILILVSVNNVGSKYEGLAVGRYNVSTNKGYATIRIITDQVAKYELDGSSSPNLLEMGSHNLNTLEQWWHRLRLEGSNLRCKTWKKGAAEPGWDNYVDTGLKGPGRHGLVMFDEYTYVDYFAVATAGATAQWPPYMDVYDEVTVTDVVDDIAITDVEELSINEFETVTVTEDVTISLPDALEVSVFDTTTVTDVPGVDLWELNRNIDVFESVTVEDEETVSLPDALEASVFDQTGVTDEETVSITAPEDLTIDVFDTVTVADVETMCIYDLTVTDFSEYTTNQQPSDWSEEWNVDNATALVKTGGEFGGKILRLDHSETFPTGSRYAASWDDLSAETDGEVLALVRADAAHDNFAIVLRGGGGINTEDAYLADMAFLGDQVKIKKFNNGSYSSIGSGGSKTLDVDTWYWVRFQIRGTALKLKAWEYGTSEPDSWDDTATDSDHASGWVGIYSAYDDARDCDYFAFAPGTCATVPVPIDVVFDISEFETVTVTENVTVSLPDALEIDVFEAAITVTDVPFRTLVSYIDVFDETTVTDWVDVIAHLAVSEFEEVTVTEQVTVSLPDPLEISVFESQAVTEWVDVTVSVIGELEVSVFSPATVQDEVTVTLPDDLEVSVSDQTGVTEFTDLLFIELFVSVFDLVTLTEEVTVAPGLKIAVSDETTVLESVSLEISVPSPSVFDTVTVTDVPTVDVLVPEFLEVDTFELVTVTESVAGVASAVILSVFDTVTVTDTVELYWLLAEGLANMEFSSRAPDVEFDPRLPVIDYAERAPSIDYEVH